MKYKLDKGAHSVYALQGHQNTEASTLFLAIYCEINFMQHFIW